MAVALTLGKYCLALKRRREAKEKAKTKRITGIKEQIERMCEKKPIQFAVARSSTSTQYEGL